MKTVDITLRIVYDDTIQNAPNLWNWEDLLNMDAWESESVTVINQEEVK